MEQEQKETTFYRFYSEIRAFLSKLIKDPIKADTSKYLKDRGFTKAKTISVLMSKDILDRKETIKDPTDGEEYKKATYFVTYKVRKKDFERRIQKIFIKYFEKNLPEKKKREEVDECSSCGSVGGANGMGYDVPLFGGTPVRRTIYESKKKKLHKKIYVTTQQFEEIQDIINSNNGGDFGGIEEATTTCNVGSIGNYTANGLVLKTSDGKKDPSYNR